MNHLKKCLSLCILLLPGILAPSQTAVFSLYKFTEPANWKAELRKGLVIYSEINQNEGTFGQIGLYERRTSTNDAEYEFKKDWNELITASYSVTGIPKINLTDLDPYWKVAQATVQTSRDGQNFTLRMVNFTGLGNTATIITTYTGDKYKLRIDEFISSVEMAGPANIQSSIGQVYKKGTIPVDNKPVTQPSVLTSGSSSKVKILTYGNLTYSLPAGWTQLAKSNYLSLFPSTLYQGEAIEIRILNPFNSPDFKTAATASWQEISQMYQDEIRNDIFEGRTHTTSSGWNFFSEKKHTRRSGGIDTDFELFLFANGSIMERVIIISEEFKVQGMLYSTSTRFFDDIYNFVFSIRFPAKPDEGSDIPSLEGGLITGVWTGISGGFSGYSGTYDQKTFYAVFYNSGIAYFRDRLPDHGLYQINPYIWQNVYPSYWCTYSLSGNQGAITNNYYNTMPFVLAGEKLTITKNGLDHVYTKLTSPDGMRFNGRWAFGSGESLTLNPDGSFIDMGALGIIEHSLYYKPYTVTANQGNGRYEIRNFTAIFAYSDGREFRCSFPAFDIARNNPSPANLIFGMDDILNLK
jgi:hypothetical protein